MPIVVARIDDRLLHGQVVTSWMRATSPQVVVVADEKLSDDPVQVKILKAAAPSDVRVYVMPPEKLAEKLKAGILDSYRTMLIFAGMEAPLKLLEAGIKLDSVNLGGMRFQEGRRQLSRAVSMTEEEISMARKITAMGVELEHRQLYEDNKQNVTDMI